MKKEHRIVTEEEMLRKIQKRLLLTSIIQGVALILIGITLIMRMR